MFKYCNTTSILLVKNQIKMRNKGISRNGFYDDTNLFDWIIVVLNKYVWFMCYILLSQCRDYRKYNVDPIVHI